jgi:hypothetical protein
VEEDCYLVYLVCLVCLVKQDQLDEQNKPDQPVPPVSPLHVAEMLFYFTGSVGNSVDERLVSWKMADAERPVAVCLKSGHCGPSGAAPIFCGLTDQCFPFPLFVLPWRFCAEFLVETDFLMWDATKSSIFIHSSARVPPRDERGGPDWLDAGLGRLVHLVSLVYPVGLVQLNKRDKPNEPNEPDEQERRAGCVNSRGSVRGRWWRRGPFESRGR